MKRTYLKRKGRSENARTKDRIQKLLTAIVRLRDDGCIFSHYPESGKCSGYTAADHIISRQRSISYAETWNVICVCQRHHIYWKPQNPVEYNRIVKTHIGKARWKKVERTLADQKPYHFTAYDWGNYEIVLKQELIHFNELK